jgi:hypothetical protein
VIRELLDEALSARRRKQAGIYDSEEPPGQGIAETLHTLQTLLLKLIRREELIFSNQNVGLKLLLETFAEARTGREITWGEFVRKPLLEKGRTAQELADYFNMRTQSAKEYGVELLEKVKKEDAKKG